MVHFCLIIKLRIKYIKVECDGDLHYSDQVTTTQCLPLSETTEQTRGEYFYTCFLFQFSTIIVLINLYFTELTTNDK